MSHYTTIHLHNTPAGKEAKYALSHRADLARLRGFKGAGRYEVAPEQIVPDAPQPWRYDCPSDQLVFCAQQSGNLWFTIEDFSARARGVGPSGVAAEPRSYAASSAGDVYYLKKIGGN